MSVPDTKCNACGKRVVQSFISVEEVHFIPTAAYECREQRVFAAVYCSWPCLRKDAPDV